LLPTSCVVCCAFIAYQAHAAGGAFAVDDAGVDEPGACKVESWASFSSRSHFMGSVTPACVVGIGKGLEIGGQFQRSRSDGEWATDGVVKAKYNILPIETGRWGVAISGGVGVDLLTGQTSSFFVNVPLTYQFTKEFRVNLNAGYLRERADRLDWFTWGAGLEWDFAEKFTTLVEVFGQAGKLPEVAPGDPPAPETIRQPRAQAGLRYRPVEQVDVDFIYGRNITGENAHWVTLGLNVRFNVK
jgi:hypothetical protein